MTVVIFTRELNTLYGYMIILNPDIVCVELDKQRYNAIMVKRSNPEEYKRAGRNVPVVYKLLARFQDSMAEEYGVIAGAEMLTAIDYANSHQLPLEFIDMNAQRMFTRMWKKMGFIEKLKLLLTGFGGIFVSKKRVEKELEKYEEDFDIYIEEIGKKFPTIKRVLIDERNHYMTSRLAKLNEDYISIVACLGDGHIPGIEELLQSKNIEFNTIRLNELRNHKPGESDSSSAHFSTSYGSI